MDRDFGTLKVTVPAQKRVRARQQQEMPQLVHQEVVEQAGEDSTVGAGEPGLADLALQDQQLVPKRQDLDVVVPVSHPQLAQEHGGMGRREMDHAKQHNRS
ncbi:hypothetical protein ACFRAO_36335 [Streptomyces sp. NPDC056656]|uniref:hypothetical protein n=1 Tax=Streptomyces sp. NPDC056656 TaxID=3345895 RepID=UPI003696E03A